MKISDDGLTRAIKGKYNVSVQELQDKPNEKMKAILREILLNDNITTRQIASVSVYLSG